MKSIFLRAKPSDFVIGSNLRNADILELKASGYPDPEEAMAGIIATSDCHVMWLNGKRQAIGGISDSGIIWTMTTKELIEDYPREFFGASLKFLMIAFEDHEIVQNEIWSGNTVHMKWLERMGFTIIKDKPISHHLTGEIFYKFFKLRGD